MIPVAILGGSGYTGVELIKILRRHPHAKIVAGTSRKADPPAGAGEHPSLLGRRRPPTEPFDPDPPGVPRAKIAVGLLSARGQPRGASAAVKPRRPGRGPECRLPAARPERVRPVVRRIARRPGPPGPGGVWSARGVRRGGRDGPAGGEPRLLPADSDPGPG